MVNEGFMILLSSTHGMERLTVTRVRQINSSEPFKNFFDMDDATTDQDKS